MITKKNRKDATRKRHYRLRKDLVGTTERPRLAIFRSVKHIYAQIINDDNAITLVAASTVEPDYKKENAHGSNIEAARFVGELVAKRALEKGIKQVVFDRGGNLYHGRVSALADAAREAGLDF
jgi:large subunit ribosomal protein L18